MCVFSLSFRVHAAPRGRSGWLARRSYRFHRFPRTDSSNSKTPPSRRGGKWRLARMPRSYTGISISLTLSTGTIWKTPILRKLILVAAVVVLTPIMYRRDSLTPKYMRRFLVKRATSLLAQRICGLLLRGNLTRITFLSPLNSGWFITLLQREITSSRASSS